MKELCHYTSIDSLLKIVLPDGIDFVATYFKQHGKDNYDWIRERGKRIIKELFEEHNWKYDSDCLAYNPYIISSCTSPNSFHMWNEFEGI